MKLSRLARHFSAQTLPHALAFLALALALIRPAAAQSYTFTTIAGQPPQPGSDDGTGTSARFKNPYAVAASADGTVYVADTDNHVIRKITPAGVTTTLAGSAGLTGSADGVGSAARFNSPRGLAVDPAGNVYVGDYENGVVRKITPSGTVTTLAGVAGAYGSVDGPVAVARLNGPWGIAADAGGNVFVADLDNHTIRKISGGIVTTLAGLAPLTGSTDGSGGVARFTAPTGIALDAAGNLYVVDTINSNIRKISPAGLVSTIAGVAGQPGDTNGAPNTARFNNPYGIAVDLNGAIFVSDTLNDSVRKIAPDGTVSVFAGTSGTRGSANGGGTAARFFRPVGLATDAAGNLYVADRSNHTIRKITPGASVSILAGPGGNFGSADGTGNTARFNYPLDVALDRNGNLFVADSYNSEIRKITPNGAVTTFAGIAGSATYTDGPAGIARFGYVGGIAVDANNNVFVTDVAYHTVRTLNADGLTSTYAGTPGQAGSTDGTGAAARLNLPTGLTTDTSGNVYVADSSNHVIRKITPQRVVTTVAGTAGQSGGADGVGAAARFTFPDSVTVDASGILYVADTGNSTIRKITPAGVVTTIAGVAGAPGSANGVGSAASFRNPKGLTVDPAGNLFVADTNNSIIRKITPAGVVTTIGGIAGNAGAVDGTAASARFGNPTSITIGPTGKLYLVDTGNNTISEGVLDTVPGITAQPQSIAAITGSTAILSVSATGGGLSYQWKFNGAAIAGATASTYALASAQANQAGSYTVTVINSAGTVTSDAALVTVGASSDVGRISNLAIRAQAGTGAQTLIVGIAVGGSGTSGTKPVLVRGSGPALAAFGVPGTLADPSLAIFQGNTTIATNDDWAGDPQITSIGTQLGAFPFTVATSKDAALYKTDFARNTYTVQITGNNNSTGVALAEIYDATPPASFTLATPRLTNVSARTQVGTGGDILIAGFVIGGSTAKTVLIRAVGPGLEPFGVTGVLADPKLEIVRPGSTVIVAANDNWGGAASLSAAFSAVGAFPLPAGSRDAALVLTLPPGSYTAQVSGVADTTGVALVEVYEVP